VAEIVVQEIVDAVPLNTVMQEFTGTRRSRVLERVGSMIGTMHGHGWVHGALGSPHILVQPEADDRVWLIDFDKALHSKRLVPRDLARVWRRTKHLDADDVACFHTAYNKAMSEAPE
jgi:tRNA A-37 threonylcarbamoyl transferase component Bud32